MTGAREPRDCRVDSRAHWLAYFDSSSGLRLSEAELMQ
jgi:hypothetical protein